MNGFFTNSLKLKGKVIEPLKDFHKDEVRELGLSLGLQKELVQRHPFPGNFITSMYNFVMVLRRVSNFVLCRSKLEKRRVHVVFIGPGLSIRLLCAEQPYVDDIESFLVTQHHLKIIANLPHVDEDVCILIILNYLKLYICKLYIFQNFE